MDKEGKAKVEKQTCKHCHLYHSTIEAKKMHRRKCKAEIDKDVEKEADSEEEEDDDEPEQNEQEKQEPEKSPNAEKENDNDIIMDRVNIIERTDGLFEVQCKYGVCMV